VYEGTPRLLPPGVEIIVAGLLAAS